MISEINNGKNWIDDNRKYPIRKNGAVSSYKKNGMIKNNNGIFIEKKYYCSICGTEITKYSKTGLCKKCQAESTRIVKRPLREQLKEDIRKMPFVAVGKKYDVTDNAIRKWCKYYNLPSKKIDIMKYSEKEWEEI